MTAGTRRRAWAAVLAVGLASASPRPAANEDAVAPLSPGAVARLLPGKVGPDELALWRRALADPRAETRAAGARVARVAGAASLVRPLLEAVAAEKDAGAAREEMLALASMAPGVADDALWGAAARFGGALDGTLVRAVGLRGQDALPLLPRLHGLKALPTDWSVYLAWATAEGRRSLPEAATAALDLTEVRLWGEVLSLSSSSGATLDDALLVRALSSDSAGLREQTCWYLLVHGGKIRAAVRAALASTPEAGGGGGSTPLATLAFELLGRRLGQAPRDRSALLLGLAPADRVWLPRDDAVLATLRGGEKAAYGEARFGSADAVDQRLKEASKAKGLRVVDRNRRLRTVSDFPPGLVEDVLAVTGCRPSREPRFAGVQARYGANGVLEGIGYLPTEELGSCQEAAKVLLLTSLVPTDRPPRPNETDTVVLPVWPEFLGCVAHERPQALWRVENGESTGAGIQEPHKVRNVAPRYPREAIMERRRGVVVIEAIVSEEGCIRSAEVAVGPQLDLEFAALRAVVQWRYSPTLLDGRPVPISMTVTVTFKLS